MKQKVNKLQGLKIELKKWDDEIHSVYNSEIDTQHKKLFSIINDVYSSIITHDNIDTCLLDLVLYSKYHFETEEKILNLYIDTNLKSEIEKHIEEHRQFADRVLRDIMIRLEDKDIKVGLAIFLNDWLNNHILELDIKIFKHIHTL